MFFLRWRCIGSVCVAVGLAASPAIGQTQQQIDACAYSDASPAAKLDSMVDACTDLIRSGSVSQQNRAWALNSRANIYKRKAIIGISPLDQDFAEKYKASPNYNLALNDYAEAIRIDPNGFAPYYNRAGLYGLAGENDLAIADNSKVLQLADSVDVKAMTYGKRGSEFQDKGQYDRALADYNEAIRLKPDDSSGYFGRAAVYRKMGDETRGSADWDHAYKLEQQGK
jgi:tetratricopeptide (TPR) repeat protein